MLYNISKTNKNKKEINTMAIKQKNNTKEDTQFKHFKFKLGDVVKDMITSYEGTVTGIAFYIDNDVTYLVEGIDNTGRPVEDWINEKRLMFLCETGLSHTDTDSEEDDEEDRQSFYKEEDCDCENCDAKDFCDLINHIIHKSAENKDM
jgi:uncharacterized FlaG/YvyC family protein